jgi:hypothetical protein
MNTTEQENEPWVVKAEKQAVSVGHSSTESSLEESQPQTPVVNQSQQQITPKDYWEALRQNKILPNFWQTQEYIDKAELEWKRIGQEYGWVDPRQHGWVLPPYNGQSFDTHQYIWAGFPDAIPEKKDIMLDHQYIYDAHQFTIEGLVGSQWKVYRKNIKKFPNRNPGESVYRKLENGECEHQITEMLLNWSEGKEIHDPDVMVKFLLYGQLRWGLFLNGTLVGVNIGDENWAFAIYRYCLDNGEPFLNEYLRHCFYTSEWVQQKQWVNDGGDLGNMQLASFKQKLNPTAVYIVYTHPYGIHQ